MKTKIAIISGVILTAILFAGFSSSFMFPNPTCPTGTVLKNDVCVIDEVEQGVNWSQITFMKPNSVEFFYYPEPGKDKDPHQLFMLRRLPEWMGGAENDVSSI